MGAAHIRDVDDGWPAVGTRVNHQVGRWPLHIKDQTIVRAMVPDHMIELDARAWPLGAPRYGSSWNRSGPTRPGW